MNDVKTALSAEPDNVEGRLLLARVSLRIGDVEAARKELDSAIALGADSAAVRELHYAILLAQNRNEDALISAAADDDFDPLRRLVVMARAHTALGEFDEAETSVREALAIDAGDREARLVEARLYWASGRIDEAQAKLDQLLESEPNYAEAWVAQGRVALGAGDPALASEAFSRALDNAALQLDLPELISAHVALVESKLALGDQAGAEAGLTALQARAPNAFATRFLKARLAYANGQYSAAVAELQRVVRQIPDNVQARLLLAAALFGDGAVEQAELELNRLLADRPDNLEARKQLARIYLSRNDTASARRVLAEVQTTAGVDASADWLMGTTLLLSGQPAEAIDLLERGAEADPDNVGLRLSLVEAYLVSGERDKALAILEAIPEGEGGVQRSRLAVLVEVAGRSPADAKPRIERLAGEHSGDAELLVLAARYLIGTGDVAGASRVFEQAVKADPKNADGRLALAGIALQSGDVPRAEEQLRRVLEVDKANERAYLGFAQGSLVKGDRGAAREWLERAVGADPSVVESRLRLVELAVGDGDAARAKAMADQALAVTKTRSATLARLGNIYHAASKYDDALAMFDEAAALGNRDADIRAGTVLLAQGRTDEARARFEAVARDFKDAAEPVLLLAMLDTGEKRYDQALARVAAFEKAGGADFVADEMRGDVLSAAGRQADALASFKKAASIRPSARLAIKILRTSRTAGLPNPEAGLLEWLDRNPDDQGARLALAEHYLFTGNRPAAIKAYEQLVAVAPSGGNQNNLAWLYYETGDARAEDLARRAHEAAPAEAAIADTYGWILVEKGKVKEGLPILEAAKKGMPENRDISYHHAVALARDGQKKAAADALRGLLADSQAFASRAEAQALLDKLSREELGL